MEVNYNLKILKDVAMTLLQMELDSNSVGTITGMTSNRDNMKGNGETGREW